MYNTCANCEYFYECKGACRFQEVSLPEEVEEEEDWVPDISAEDYAEWTGKGWLYE